MSLATDLKVFHSTAAHNARSSSTVLKAHCRYLISTLNKKNLKAVLAEIQQVSVSLKIFTHFAYLDSSSRNMMQKLSEAS